MPIILDGRIQHDIINEMGKDDNFVERMLRNKKIKLEEIFYAFYKDKNIFVITYNDLD